LIILVATVSKINEEEMGETIKVLNANLASMKQTLDNTVSALEAEKGKCDKLSGELKEEREVVKNLKEELER
jgi:hypothetical protein